MFPEWEPIAEAAQKMAMFHRQWILTRTRSLMFCPKTNLLLDASALFVEFSILEGRKKFLQVSKMCLSSTDQIPQKASKLQLLHVLRSIFRESQGRSETKTCRVTAEAEAAGLSNAFHQMSCNTAFLRSLTVESQLLHLLGTASPRWHFYQQTLFEKGNKGFFFPKSH